MYLSFVKFAWCENENNGRWEDGKEGLIRVAGRRVGCCVERGKQGRRAGCRGKSGRKAGRAVERKKARRVWRRVERGKVRQG